MERHADITTPFLRLLTNKNRAIVIYDIIKTSFVGEFPKALIIHGTRYLRAADVIAYCVFNVIRKTKQRV